MYRSVSTTLAGRARREPTPAHANPHGTIRNASGDFPEPKVKDDANERDDAVRRRHLAPQGECHA